MKFVFTITEHTYHDYSNIYDIILVCTSLKNETPTLLRIIIDNNDFISIKTKSFVPIGITEELLVDDLIIQKIIYIIKKLNYDSIMTARSYIVNHKVKSN